MRKPTSLLTALLLNLGLSAAVSATPLTVPQAESQLDQIFQSDDGPALTRLIAEHPEINSLQYLEAPMLEAYLEKSVGEFEYDASSTMVWKKPRPRCMEALILAGVDPNGEVLGTPILERAIEAANGPGVRFLLAHGARVADGPAHEHNRALWALIDHVPHRTLAAGEKLEIEDAKGKRFFDGPTSVELVGAFIEHGADLNHRDMTILSAAEFNKVIEPVITLLKSKGAKENTELGREYPLAAVWKGWRAALDACDVSALQKILAEHPELHKQIELHTDRPVLEWSVSEVLDGEDFQKQIAVLEFLLAQGASQSGDLFPKGTAIGLAISRGNLVALPVLLRFHPEMQPKSSLALPPLYVLADCAPEPGAKGEHLSQAQTLSVAHQLLAAGADPNFEGLLGTPLAKAEKRKLTYLVEAFKAGK